MPNGPIAPTPSRISAASAPACTDEPRRTAAPARGATASSAAARARLTGTFNGSSDASSEGRNAPWTIPLGRVAAPWPARGTWSVGSPTGRWNRYALAPSSAARCAASGGRAPARRATRRRTAGASGSHPAAGRETEEREQGVRLPLALVDPRTHLGLVGGPFARPAVGPERVRIRVEQDLVGLAMDDPVDHPVQPGVVRDRREIGPDLRARVTQPHGLDVAGQDERVGSPVGAAGDDRRVERIGQGPFEQPSKASIGDPEGRVPDAPFDGLTAERPVGRRRALPGVGPHRTGVGHVSAGPRRHVFPTQVPGDHGRTTATGTRSRACAVDPERPHVARDDQVGERVGRHLERDLEAPGVRHPLDRMMAVGGLVRRPCPIDPCGRPRSHEHRSIAGRPRGKAGEVLMEPPGDRAQGRMVQRVHRRIREPVLGRPRVPPLPDGRRALRPRSPSPDTCPGARPAWPARDGHGRTGHAGRARCPEPGQQMADGRLDQAGEPAAAVRRAAARQQSEPESEGIARWGLLVEPPDGRVNDAARRPRRCGERAIASASASRPSSRHLNEQSPAPGKVGRADELEAARALEGKPVPDSTAAAMPPMWSASWNRR